MIEISRAATDFILESSNQQDTSDDKIDGLRIAVYPDTENSCFNYGFGFDVQKDSDEIYEENGVKLIIDQEQTELLDNASIDYIKLDNGKMNLIVLNPNDPSHVPPKKDKPPKS